MDPGRETWHCIVITDLDRELKDRSCASSHKWDIEANGEFFTDLVEQTGRAAPRRSRSCKIDPLTVV